MEFRNMKIKWLGHASFLVTTASGTRILHDPYQDMLGYKMPRDLEVDIVLSSHDHSDHNCTTSLKPGFDFISTLGTTVKSGVIVNGISSYHDDVAGEKRGENIIFSYIVDNLKVAHLGDLGHTLTAEQIDALKGVDVLFLPVGGGYTIDGKLGVKVVQQIEPKVVIPMHYRTPALRLLGFKFKKVDSFLKEYGKDYEYKSELIINEETIDDVSDVVILDYK